MRLSYVRELDEYPTGARRMKILTMAVLAILIGSYEGQIAPVVPLLLKDLDMTLTMYGAVSGAAAVAGAIASILGGRLTDRLGRVRLLIPLMALTAVCCFAMTLVHSPRDLLIARIVLAFVDGVAMASTAPLIRDFSPRLGRAQAFGFWTWGPVGANFLAAAVAGWTLPIFNDSWRSQFVIMALLLAGHLRGHRVQHRGPLTRAARQDPAHRTGRHRRGGPDAAGPRALAVHAAQHLGARRGDLPVAGALHHAVAVRPDDAGRGARRQQRRGVHDHGGVLEPEPDHADRDRAACRTARSSARPFCLGGTVSAVIVTGYLAVSLGQEGVSTGTLMVVGALLGGSLGVAYAPWMANYSEDAEDADPRLQGTALGVVRVPQQGDRGDRAAGHPACGGGHELADVVVRGAGVSRSVRSGDRDVQRAVAAAGRSRACHRGC
ncbi:MFS transporter [Nonomuraea rubra]|uniref:MFS transporter n=1 Tax=Nonomuraea rubra TaxID=46180 RepID=UPI0031E6541B